MDNENNQERDEKRSKILDFFQTGKEKYEERISPSHNIHNFRSLYEKVNRPYLSLRKSDEANDYDPHGSGPGAA